MKKPLELFTLENNSVVKNLEYLNPHNLCFTNICDALDHIRHKVLVYGTLKLSIYRNITPLRYRNKEKLEAAWNKL